MGEAPQTLADVKSLLEQAVQVVDALVAADSTPVDPAAPAETPDADDQAVADDEAKLAADQTTDAADDTSGDAAPVNTPTDTPTPPAE